MPTIATGNVRHNGVLYTAGSEIKDLKEQEKERLLRLKAAEWVEESQEQEETPVQEDENQAGAADDQVKEADQVEPAAVEPDKEAQNEVVAADADGDDTSDDGEAVDVDLSLGADKEEEKPAAKKSSKSTKSKTE